MAQPVSNASFTPIDFQIFDQPCFQNHWSGNCIGCSLTNPIGFHLHFWAHQEECWSKTTVPETCAAFKILPMEGITATLLDEIGAYALGLKYKMFGFTLSANVPFPSTGTR